MTTLQERYDKGAFPSHTFLLLGVFQCPLDDEGEPVGKAAPVGFRRPLRTVKEFIADAEVGCRHVVSLVGWRVKVRHVNAP